MLYNFIIHFWLKISTSILWFRLFNVFIGFGSGIFLFLILKKYIATRLHYLVYVLCQCVIVGYFVLNSMQNIRKYI